MASTYAVVAFAQMPVASAQTLGDTGPLPDPPVQPVSDDWAERPADVVVGSEQWERDLDGDGTADRRYCCVSGGVPRFRPLDAQGEASTNVVQADVDEDGYFEMVQWDPTGDGDRDRADVDTNRDGNYDTVYLGWDGTRFSTIGLDTNHDGHRDRVRVDRNGDGVPDIEYIDTDGSLPMDEIYIDADFDGRFDVHYLDHDGSGTVDERRTVGRPDGEGWVDLDGDGDIDQDWSDTDGDGIAETTDIDTGDGVQRLIDADRDGVYERGVITGADGTVEEFVDVDGDGLFDTWSRDTDGDGVADVFSYDVDGDGQRDAGIWARDTDGDGTADVRYEDTDGDGAADLVFPSDESGRPVPGGTVEFDRDGDGRFEERHEDVDGDGVIDHAYYDVDGDGAPDTTVSDDDQDGHWDVASRDTDGDGFDDEWAIDSDGDNLWDTWERDTDGDGAADVWSYDRDGDGVRDAGTWEVDTDGDGVADVRYEDTDGDGFADVEEELGDPSDDDEADDAEPNGDDDVGGWEEVNCAYDLANHAHETLGPVSLPRFSDDWTRAAEDSPEMAQQGGVRGCQALSLVRPNPDGDYGASLAVQIWFDPAAHAAAVDDLPEVDVVDGGVTLADQPGVRLTTVSEPLCRVEPLFEIYATRFTQDGEIGLVTIGQEPLPSLLTKECSGGRELEVGGVRVRVDAFSTAFMCSDYVATIQPGEFVMMFWSEDVGDGEWVEHDYRLDGPHVGTICPPEVIAEQPLPSEAAFDAEFASLVVLMEQIVDRVGLPAWLFDEDAFEAAVLGQ